MKNNKTFDNPILFLEYLKSQPLNELEKEELKNLVQASVSAIELLVKSQEFTSQKLFDIINILNTHHKSWGEKLSQLYRCVAAGDISADDMDKVLKDEICSKD